MNCTLSLYLFNISNRDILDVFMTVLIIHSNRFNIRYFSYVFLDNIKLYNQCLLTFYFIKFKKKVKIIFVIFWVIV